MAASFQRETSELSKKPDKTPAELGLREADDLLRIFRTIELQNLNALVNLESLNGPMADMEAKIQVAEVRVRTEIDEVLDKIKELEVTPKKKCFKIFIKKCIFGVRLCLFNAWDKIGLDKCNNRLFMG